MTIAPFVVAAALAAGTAQAEIVREVRIHGNVYLTDAEVLAVAGVEVGDAITAESVPAIEKRLRDSGRFETVQVRKRYRSLADPTDVAIVLVVHEKPGVVSATSSTAPVFTPWRRLRSRLMFLPILNYGDGYGFTYGARLAFKDTIGDRSRVSVPMTWGGERRIGLEAERSFDGPISIVRGGVGLYRRVNPFFDLSDRRTEARAEADRIFTSWFRAGVDARVAQVEFGPDYEARHSAAGFHTVFDTRIDPSFPRNAIHTRIGWERLFFGESAGRWDTDARGYVGVGGSLVLALRAQLIRSDSSLPFAEQSLFGGSGTVRGYATGHRAGDNLFAASAELRIPLNSPLTFGRFGLKTFVDAGTAWNTGSRWDDEPLDRGIGGGVYIGGGPFIIDLDIAKPRRGDVRAHFGMGVTF